MILQKPRELHDLEFWQQLDREEILLHDYSAWRKLDQLQSDMGHDSTKEQSDISNRRDDKQKRKTIKKLLKYQSFNSESIETKKKQKEEMLEKYFQKIKGMYIADLEQNNSQHYTKSTSSNVY